jgi:hypothetical protein
VADLATSEVLEGEVVEERPLTKAEIPSPPQKKLYTRKRREQIIKALKGGEVKTSAGKKAVLKTQPFLADAARFAGIPPSLLYAWLDHGRSYPAGPLGRFAAEVDRIRAEHNTDLKAKVEKLAEERKDWQGIARIGEQYDAESWQRPSEGKGTQITVNIIDKLQAAHAADNKALAPGD